MQKAERDVPAKLQGGGRRKGGGGRGASSQGNQGQGLEAVHQAPIGCKGPDPGLTLGRERQTDDKQASLNTYYAPAIFSIT